MAAVAEQVRTRELLTGGEAIAHAMCQIDPDVFPVYPITPQTPIIQTFAKLAADGRASTEIINVESEHSAMSAAVGAALAGARTMTATSSQGLALMAEVVYIAAGMRAPIVMALGNRALSAPLNIHCDHSDSMLIRDSGVVQLFAESAQEAYDLTVMGPRIAERADVMLPVLVCLDGFTLTHSAEGVELARDDEVKDFVGEYSIPSALLDTQRPATFGACALPDYYYELRHQLNAAMEAAESAIAETAALFAEEFGRVHPLVERYRLDDADTAIVLMGASAGTAKDVVDELRAAGESVGLLRIISYRPFPAALIRLALESAKRVVILDRSDAPGAYTSLQAEVATALFGMDVELRSHVFGLGGRELLPSEVHDLFAGHLGRYVGIEEWNQMSRIKELARAGRAPALGGGHALCQGCGIPVVVRTVLSSIRTPVVVVNATGCLEVATTRFPMSAWNVPWMHVAFENTAAVASGVESAYQALRKRGRLPGGDNEVTIVAFAGDGGTYDIGFQALSGALERGHRFLFVCYDNEAYMNTGVQRSGATPFAANTTTSPAGKVSIGKLQQRKDMTAIAAAHHVPYVAQAAGTHWHDLSVKVERAVASRGAAFLNVLSDCPVGWGHEPRDTFDIVNSAVDSLFWPLYEVADGEWKLTYRPKKTIPVETWLQSQARFKHLLDSEHADLRVEIQTQVEKDWQALLRRCGETA